MCKFVKMMHNYASYSLGILQGWCWKIIAEVNPQMSARREMRRQKQNNLLRPVDITNPIYFNEKMLWLKYYIYNKSPIVAQCYNKYAVREYVKNKGLGYILNDLYGVWNHIDDIPWDNLPEEYVIKLSNGYAGHIFKYKETTLDIKKMKGILNTTKKRCSYAFKMSGDLFVYGTRPVFICERMLHSSYGFKSPEDYKFYCFNGNPLYLNYFCNRRYENGKMLYDMGYLDLITWKNRNDLENGCVGEMKELPKSLKEMVKIATILSQDFPFVRVDLYEENENVIFGELTFTPYHSQTRTSLVELGNKIDFGNIEEYKKRLQVK